MKKRNILQRFKKATTTEFKASITGMNRREIWMSQIMYAFMNFAGGGGIAGMPISSLISLLVVKSSYDGHRYHKGDKNFDKKRIHFIKNMCIGLLSGTLPRMLENIRQLAEEYGATTLLELNRLIFEHVGDIVVVEGGLWNERSLAAMLVFQLYGHAKQIAKTTQNTQLDLT